MKNHKLGMISHCQNSELVKLANLCWGSNHYNNANCVQQGNKRNKLGSVSIMSLSLLNKAVPIRSVCISEA